MDRSRRVAVKLPVNSLVLPEPLSFRGFCMTLSPFAGKPAPAELLVDIPRLVTAYYTGQPDANISTQLRRTHRRRPAITPGFREFPNQPHVRKIFQSTNRLRIAVFRFKHNPALQFLHQSTLTRNAEFCGKISADTGDNRPPSPLKGELWSVWLIGIQ